MKRVSGRVCALEIRKVEKDEITFSELTVRTSAGRDIRLARVGAPPVIADLIRSGDDLTLYVHYMMGFVPSRIFGVRVGDGHEAFSAPRAIVWIPGMIALIAVATPLALLPVTLLLFPLLVAAAVFQIFLVLDGLSARGAFKRDARRLEREARKAAKEAAGAARA